MILLASQSPRRHELLQQVGVAHEILAMSVDESPLPDELPRDYVRRVTLAKANAAQLLKPERPVLAADTCVVSRGKILGKPREIEDAMEMLQQLSATTHEVLTGVTLLFDGQQHYKLSTNRVRFRHIHRSEARQYWQTGEPLGKAGGYAIQGLGALFIEHIAGSYSGIMGLPLFETGQLLEKLHGKTGQYS